MKRNVRRNIWVAVAAVVAVAVIVVVAQRKGGGDAYKIGGDLTLSGDTAFWSEQLRKGFDLAIDESNAAHPGEPKIVMVYEDNQGSVAKAVSAWQKLDAIDGVSMVVSCFTPMCKPLRDNAEKSQLPLLAAVTAAADFSKGFAWSFRDYMSQEVQGPAAADYAFRTLKLTKAATMVVNDDFGLDGAREFSAEFRKLGGQVVAAETFEQKDTDVRAQAGKVLAAKPDGVFIVGRNQSHVAAIKQLRELGFAGRMLGGNGFDADPTMKIVGDAGNGFVFTSAYYDLDGTDVGRRFRDAYRKRYNEAPEHVSVYGYTMGQYSCRAVREAKGDRAGVKRALEQMSMPETIRGPLRMNADRDVVSPLGVYEFQSGARKLLEKRD